MRAFSVPGLVIVMVVEWVVSLASSSASKSKVSRVCVLADSCSGVILMPWTSSAQLSFLSLFLSFSLSFSLFLSLSL
jgi:hypothetical protein